MYREGGAKFARAAATLAEDKRRAHPEATVRAAATQAEDKRRAHTSS